MDRLTCLKRGHALPDLRVLRPDQKTALYTYCRQCGMTTKRGEVA